VTGFIIKKETDFRFRQWSRPDLRSSGRLRRM